MLSLYCKSNNVYKDIRIYIFYQCCLNFICIYYIKTSIDSLVLNSPNYIISIFLPLFSIDLINLEDHDLDAFLELIPDATTTKYYRFIDWDNYFPNIFFFRKYIKLVISRRFLSSNYSRQRLKIKNTICLSRVIFEVFP